ncbi:MAG: 50S ribosomal protein L22 [Candidatus Dependentiae bacterium]|nr:50S ribosomal protein L22 [Candidatus Dependentiae bacterium]
MQFTAKARYVRFSPYKLRILVDVIRGKNVLYALNWLSTCALKRAEPIKKMVESAVANAKDLQNINVDSLSIKDIRIDEGPTYKYFKPGAMGRSNGYKRRVSHMSVVLVSAQEAVTKEA